MLVMRLQRVGRKNHAEFRVVLVESSRGPKTGNVVEFLGSYNPHTNAFLVKEDRVTHWISKGAQASDTLHNLLVTAGIVKGEKRNVLPKKTPIRSEKAPEEKAPETKTPEATPSEASSEEVPQEDVSTESDTPQPAEEETQKAVA